ncbi:MAG: beta-Ala-His dipeptidase [Candidatus Lokiarchaeota archaeon]|nr:beta-Ala-His dipeptidase [Candidatus Lokiarchaeota archaeon]
MSKLIDLGQPSEFWEYFEQITKIPRCSEHEEKVRTYIVEEAERLGFETKIDGAGNLVVRVPSNTKQKQKAVLQCHLDMVCEKNEGIIHDFFSDPLTIKIEQIKGEKWVSADGTTLGADNGVGICYLLTIMKKIHNSELDFGSLGFDLLFTIDEEMGLNGAFKIDNDLIDGNFLINLDAEDEDAVTIGCAGGRVSIFHIKNDTFEIKKEDNLIPIKIFVSGLLGGHSGADIHLGRGNALKLIVQILWKLNKEYVINIKSITGGNRTNAIPREANAIVFIKEANFSEMKEYLKELVSKIKVVFDGIEPNLSISIERTSSYDNTEVFSKTIQTNILDILYTIPNGALSMHPQIKDLVFTSSNLGVIKTSKEKIEIKISQRSLSKYFKIALWEKTKSLFELTGLELEIEIASDYPGWIPNFNSKILALTRDVYKDLYKEEIEVKAIHAGLECGVLKKKFPYMEMISIGPNNVGAHSPDERISVQSVEKIWNFLLMILRKSC